LLPNKARSSGRRAKTPIFEAGFGWDLIRKGVVSHVLYKVGEEPGFFAVLNAPNLEQAKAMADGGHRATRAVRLGTGSGQSVSALLSCPEGDV